MPREKFSSIFISTSRVSPEKLLGGLWSGTSDGQILTMSSLIEAFHEYFQLIEANTPDLLRKVYTLRYEVLCKELHIPDFELDKFPDKLETDEYDIRSVHYLMKHRQTGLVVGTVRLVLPDPRDLGAPFPIEKYAGNYINKIIVGRSSSSRSETGEISRLILARTLRKRKGEDISPYGFGGRLGLDFALMERPSSDRRYFPHPMLGLLVAVVRMSADHGVNYWYAGMESVLNRLLRRFSVQLLPIGPVVNYHGLRKPYFANAREVLARAHLQNPQLWELLTDCGRLFKS